MCLLIKSSMCRVQGAMLVVLTALCFVGCGVQDQSLSQSTTFYNVDSLVAVQVKSLKSRELNKSVAINGKNEEIKFTPDSAQWAKELEIFKRIDQVNKSSFHNAYSVSEMRDANSNLMIREIMVHFEADNREEVPVRYLKLYYLKTLNDVRKIEALFIEKNALYTDTRKMTLEFERSRILHQYRIEGSQKMMMNDSVNFVVAGTIE